MRAFNVFGLLVPSHPSRLLVDAQRIGVFGIVLLLSLWGFPVVFEHGGTTGDRSRRTQSIGDAMFSDITVMSA